MDAELLKIIVVGIVLIGVPVSLVLAGPIGKAIAARIAGGRRPSERDDSLDDVPRRLEEHSRLLEATQERLIELEERVDFAERMLAQHAPEKELGKPR